MTYYAQITENQILSTSINGTTISDSSKNIEITEDIYKNIQEFGNSYYIYKNGEFVLNPDYEEEQAQKERERLDELFMTKSDFFDGTIKAFGADQKDLQPAIEALLNNLPLDNVQKKIAINNFENAQNFYRKHKLFTILSNQEIILENENKIKVTSEQWDKFFYETAKGNSDAYKELLHAEDKSDTETVLSDNDLSSEAENEN